MLFKSEEQIKHYFYIDGSLRDIYVLDTCLTDWNDFLNYIVKSEYIYDIGLYRDNEIIDFKGLNITDLFNLKKEHFLTLSFRIDDVLICCHFFTIDEIELDVDPSNINLNRVNSIVNFMKKLSIEINKEVILTPENTKEIELIKVDLKGSIHNL